MRRLACLIVVVLGVAAAPAHAAEGVMPDGVTIGGIPVGGLTAEEAAAAVQAVVDEPLVFTFKARKRTWKAFPWQFAIRPYVDGAVSRALAAAPGEQVDLVIRFSPAKVRSYVAHLDRVFSRPAVDSKLRLRKLRPFVTKPRVGVRVKKGEMTWTIFRALAQNLREPIPLAHDLLRPKVTRANFGPVIVIRRESKRLYLYDGMRYRKRFPVATGLPQYPTPLGRFSIIVKAKHPWWYPPNSDWAKGLEPVPPGPGNPLGTRWMGISSPGVGMHGTPDAASIGYSASHGCIRLRIPDAEWLFERVYVGTPVFIVRA